MENQWVLWLYLISLSTFLVATTCLGSQNSTASCHEQERLALLKFKYSVKDDFKMLSSWVGVDCCSWDRVRCDGSSGRVVSLHLRGNLGAYSYFCWEGYGYSNPISDDLEEYLTGDNVNSSLAELRHLKYLDLSGNDFQQSLIPEFIGSLKQLSYLNLSNAGFSGNIPHHIGNLSNLKVLALSSTSNSMQMLTADDMVWISGLLSLEYLDLNGVNLGAAKNRHMVLYMIPSIIHLSLSCCGYSNIHLADPHLNYSRILPNIKYLHLSDNKIGGQFPYILLNMSSLESLDLSHNLLNSSIPFWPSLEALDLSSNKLSGPIPKSLGRLTSLRVLNLASNTLEGPIRKPLGRLRFLEILDLSSNKLNGPIPEYFGSLVTLRYLNLESNQLTGPIPTSLGRIATLKRLSLSSNMLNGTIPARVGKLTKLYFLDLSNNCLEGLVSEAHFSNLSMLKYMDFSSNRNLTFNISREWIAPFQLRSLQLSSCKIEDGFPRWLQTQTKLKNLVLFNASLHGILPTWLQKMPIIHFLDLSHNKLSGSLINLPFNGLGNSLLLQNNLFNGSIPMSLCRRRNMIALDVSKNRLSGNIPQCMGNLDVEVLILSSNALSGVLPSSLGNISALSWLQLNDNYFTGELPRELGNLGLSVLDLGNNEFSGNIPRWIGKNLTYLVVLRLHKNNFTGRIPESLCKTNLQILDVAQNSLTGTIPHCFGELSGMIERQPEARTSYDSDNSVIQVMKGSQLKYEYAKTLDLVFNLDLSSNKLTGQIPPKITALAMLVGLNLSHNHLSGSIPDSIGNMKALNSLDFSDNQFTGMIPQSMADLNFLSYLNLSHNKLSGRIPTGSQLQTLTDPLIYAGNINLCGAPLPNNCSNHENPPTTANKKHEGTNKPKKVWFYLDIMCGFATGFWGIIGVLSFKKQWRQKLLMIAEDTIDKIYVAVAIAVRVSKIKRGQRSNIDS